jgi:hypothetical protein
MGASKLHIFGRVSTGDDVAVLETGSAALLGFGQEYVMLMVVCEMPSCTECCPVGQLLSLTVLVWLELTKLPVPSFWAQVSTTGSVVQIFAWVTTGAEVVLEATGSEVLAGLGQE